MARHRLTGRQKTAANSALRFVKDQLGGWEALAAALVRQSGEDITFQGCWHWTTENAAVPDFWAKELEKLMEGRVTRKDFRPDIFDDQ